MKKTNIAKALLPFALMGAPAAMANSSTRNGTKFKTKNVVVQNSSKVTKGKIEKDVLKDPFSIFGSSKKKKVLKENSKSDVISFLESENLLNNSEEKVSISSGDTTSLVNRLDFASNNGRSCTTSPILCQGDNTAPTVSGITVLGSPSASSTSVTFSVDFSENVKNVDTSDFELTTTGSASGTVSAVSASTGDPITVTVNSISGVGTIRLDIKSSHNIQDTGGSNSLSGGYTSGATHTVNITDTTLPSVQSITLLNSPAQNATSLTYQITFNENVSSVTTDDFELITTTGNATGTIASVSSATGTNMNVTINNVNGIGTLKLNLKANTDIVDDSGNGNNTNGYVSQFTNGDTHTAVVVDHDAQLVANNGVDESVEIKLPSTSNTLAEKVDLLDFTISDGGTNDSYPTDISEIRVNVIGTTSDTVRGKIKWLLNGSDTSNVEGQYDSTSDVVKFSSLNISVANNSSENYTVSAYFQNPTGLTDNSTIGLSVDGDSDLTLDANKTQMSSSNAPVTNSTNAKVDITATKLIIIRTPSKIAEVN